MKNYKPIFKVVKNNSTLISDTEIKEKVVTAINFYFSIENWDFRDTFYFSELAAYPYNELSPRCIKCYHCNPNFPK